MKTTKQAIKDAPNMERLIKAVIKQVGGTENIDGLRSADDGYPGFTYYSDTHKFAMVNRKPITELLHDMADDMGEDILTMVKGFGVFRNGGMDSQDIKDLYAYIGGGKPEQGAITNIMAWLALEEVARIFND